MGEAALWPVIPAPSAWPASACKVSPKRPGAVIAGRLRGDCRGLFSGRNPNPPSRLGLASLLHLPEMKVERIFARLRAVARASGNIAALLTSDMAGL